MQRSFLRVILDIQSFSRFWEIKFLISFKENRLLNFFLFLRLDSAAIFSHDTDSLLWFPENKWYFIPFLPWDRKWFIDESEIQLPAFVLFWRHNFSYLCLMMKTFEKTSYKVISVLVSFLLFIPLALSQISLSFCAFCSSLLQDTSCIHTLFIRKEKN